MPTKEITCSCGLRSTIRYSEGKHFVACPACHTQHRISLEPFRSRAALTEKAEVCAAEDIKKGEIIERCPLMPVDVDGWRFFNNSGERVIPLGLVLRYSSAQVHNVVIDIGRSLLTVYAARPIKKGDLLCFAKGAKNEDNTSGDRKV